MLSYGVNSCKGHKSSHQNEGTSVVAISFIWWLHSSSFRPTWRPQASFFIVPCSSCHLQDVSYFLWVGVELRTVLADFIIFSMDTPADGQAQTCMLKFWVQKKVLFYLGPREERSIGKKREKARKREKERGNSVMAFLVCKGRCPARNRQWS